jgi:phage terminase small subunit
VARGGARPGAGRPRKLKTVAAEGSFALPSRQRQNADELPLEYMLRIMRDPTVDPARRDKMAALAAPFCHPRIYDNRFGKRDAALEEAHKAAEDSEWADDLGPVDRRLVN